MMVSEVKDIYILEHTLFYPKYMEGTKVDIKVSERSTTIQMK